MPMPLSRFVPSRSGREIGWVLLMKGLAIYLLWTLFFSPAHQVHPTPASTADQVFGTAPADPPRSEPHE